MLQALAYHAVGVEQVGCGDTFAIGRVGDDDGLVLGLHEVLKVLLLDGDAAGESGCLDVGASRVHGLVVDVVAVDMVAERLLLRVIVIYGDSLAETGILSPCINSADVVCVVDAPSRSISR